MNTDKNYQIYIESYNKLLDERLHQAEEYLESRKVGVSIIVYRSATDIQIATINRCEIFEKPFIMPFDRVNPFLPHDFFISQLKCIVNRAVDLVNERNKKTSIYVEAKGLDQAFEAELKKGN